MNFNEAKKTKKVKFPFLKMLVKEYPKFRVSASSQDEYLLHINLSDNYNLISKSAKRECEKMIDMEAISEASYDMGVDEETLENAEKWTYQEYIDFQESHNILEVALSLQYAGHIKIKSFVPYNSDLEFTLKEKYESDEGEYEDFLLDSIDKFFALLKKKN